MPPYQLLANLYTALYYLRNHNIQFLFEEESVTYSLICDNDWDITKDDAVIYAYVWKINGDHDWIPLEIEVDPNGNSNIIDDTIPATGVSF